MTTKQVEKSVKSLLESIDQLREGTKETPRRVREAYDEMLSGYDDNPQKILSTTFVMDGDGDGEPFDGLISVKDIEFYSLCEHHLLPFVGRANIAYLPGPDGDIVGLSKLARLVECFARRLQCQERLTTQIARSIERNLEPLGVFVHLEAEHFCMKMRGVDKQFSSMATTEALGRFRTDSHIKDEALSVLDLT